MEFLSRFRRAATDTSGEAPVVPFAALPEVNQRITVWIEDHAPVPTRVEDLSAAGIVIAAPNLPLDTDDAVSVSWEDEQGWYTLDTAVVSVNRASRVPTVIVARSGRLSRRHNRREEQRVDAVLGLELRCVAARVVKTGQTLQTHTSELGSNALRFVTSSPLAPGDVLEAKLSLDDGVPVVVRLRVIRMDTVSGSWRQTCTATYDEVLASDRERIHAYVSARTVERIPLRDTR